MLEAAYALFIEKGYASVSLDDIIRISGGSKSSLYSFFGNKEGLLKAVIEALAGEMLEEIQMPLFEDLSPRAALLRIGKNIGSLALSENALHQYQLAVTNAKGNPELSKLWYDFGPKSTFDGLAEYFRKESESGNYRIQNPERAALFFLGMIVFKDNMAMSIGAAPPSKAELNAIVHDAVDVFLAAYGTETSAPKPPQPPPY